MIIVIKLLTKASDETQNEEETSKSKVSSFWSSFLYMLIEKQSKLGHTSSYQLLLNHHFIRHSRPILIVY